MSFLKIRILIFLLTAVLCRNLYAQDHSDSVAWLQQHLADQQVALLINKQNFLPLKYYRNKRQINIVTGNHLKKETIGHVWDCYSRSDYLYLSNRPNYDEIFRLNDTLRHYDLACLHIAPDDKILTPQILSLLEILDVVPTTLILVLYTDHSWVEKIISLEKATAVIVAHEPSEQNAIAVVKGIFGGIPFIGMASNQPSLTTVQSRIHFCSSLESGIAPTAFQRIDSIVQDGIQQKAFPGCQIIAVWKGIVIFEKCYGHHTFEQETRVSCNHLYDLASLTKILATTPALIKLDHQEIINVNNTLGHYLEITKGSNKENLSIKEVLSHRAGLQSWIPFYKRYASEYYTDTSVFSSTYSTFFSTTVCDHLFAHHTLTDTMMRRVIDSPLKKKHKYLYSDLGMIMLKFAIEETTKLPFDEYLDDEIYAPLNLFAIGYNPLLTYPKTMIVPTEYDNYFRKTFVHGYVHDPAAAMMGGTAGHAGLFSTARDVAIMMYTLSHDGSYGRITVFDAETINHFNHQHYNRLRRGLGFDKPETTKGNKPNVTPYASAKSFGHSGFTGTFTWADPENDLVYVFLSNRLTPDGNSTLLTSLGIRKRIHSALYEIILQANRTE